MNFRPSGRIKYSRRNSFKSLINYENINHQAFPLPFFIIKYIAKNCNMFLSQKLMVACKYLRIIQIRHGFCHLYKFILCPGADYSQTDGIFFRLYWDIRAYCDLDYEQDLCFSELIYPYAYDTVATVFKSIKVWDTFQTHTVCHNFMDTPEWVKLLYLKVDLSDVKYLLAHKMPLDVLMPIMPYALQKLYFVTMYPSVAIYLFEKMQNLNYILLYNHDEYREKLTSEFFKQLNGIKRKTKFKHVEFRGYMSSDLEVRHIYDFVDIHMEHGGNFIFSFGDDTPLSHDKYTNFLSEMEKHKKMRKEKNIPGLQISCHIRIVHKDKMRVGYF